jgi:DNA-binding GntR family transcriptional regulator
MSMIGEALVLSAPANRTLSDTVAEQLRQAILGGQLKPGQRLVEHEIASAMQLSRGPVRDALKLLENQNLVVRQPHRGTFVAGLTARDAEEIYSFREALEMLAMDHALKRVTDSQLAELDRLVDEMANCARLGCSQAEATDLDLGFHHYLMNISGHSRILAAWEALQPQVRLLILAHRFLQPSDFVEKGIDWHRELISTMRTRDLARARETLSRHLASSYDTVMASFDSSARDS